MFSNCGIVVRIILFLELCLDKPFGGGFSRNYNISVLTQTQGVSWSVGGAWEGRGEGSGIH